MLGTFFPPVSSGQEIPLGGLIAFILKLLNSKCEILIPYYSQDITTFIQNWWKKGMKTELHIYGFSVSYNIP